MGTAERRKALMTLLCRRRHETISNIAIAFGVSERTIRRDIAVLSTSEPIYTQAGKYGGVYVMEHYQMDRMYFQDAEAAVCQKLLTIAKTEVPCILTKAEFQTLQNIVEMYTKPSLKKHSKE